MTSLSLLAAVAPCSLNLLADVQAMLQYDFMRAAFLTATVTAVLAGLVGYFVVLRQVAFAGDTLSHVAFTGSLFALILGLNPLVGLFGLTALGGLGMGLLGERARARDEAIGTLLAWVLGLGALFLSLYTTSGNAANSAIGVNVLFGSIFGLTAAQVHLTLVGGGVAIALLLLLARPLLFASLDPDVAAAHGVPVRALSAVFLLLVGITVAEAVPAVGALLVFSLLITPAAIAQRLLPRPFPALLLSALLALLLALVGLTLGFYTPYPVSFLITALATLAYTTMWLWQRLVRPRAH
ncbi:MAG: metal ABC transporter permease [Chloroflexota bacterium]